MSLDATRWAWSVKVESAAQRLVLLAMADCCRRFKAAAFPSRERLSAMTSLDLKTVSKATAGLKELGLIRDTGKRIGERGRIAVYELGIYAKPKEALMEEKRNDIAPPQIEEKRNDIGAPCPPLIDPFLPSLIDPKTERLIDPKTDHITRKVNQGGMNREVKGLPAGEKKAGPLEDADWLNEYSAAESAGGRPWVA